MRLWSIHPCYLDPAGLTACWREALLAKKVLEGKTMGYRNHPQLTRFRKSIDPIRAIDTYLFCIYNEATDRGYKYDKTKIGETSEDIRLEVTSGQINFEFGHLQKKLSTRKPELCDCLKELKTIKPHPLFDIVDGEVEEWESI